MKRGQVSGGFSYEEKFVEIEKKQVEKTELGVSKEDYVKGVMYLFESFELLFELLGEIVLTMFLGIFERIVNYIYIYMLEI